MARPDVATRPFQRDELESVFGRRTRLIRQMESLAKDVAETLPDAAENNGAAIEAAQSAADAAVAAAASAQASATAAGDAAAAAQATATAAGTTASSAATAAAAAQATADAVAAVAHVVMAADPAEANARTLAVGLGLALTDGGPGGAATLNTSDLAAVLPADVSDAAGALVNATGLALALVANATYIIEGLITFQAAAATTGLALAFTLPAGASISGIWGLTSGAVVITGSYNNASGAVGGNTANSAAATTNLPIIGRWIVTTGATPGNAQLQFRTEVAASAITLKAGLSVLTARRLV